ncbi:hypothetical protein M0804_001211 [Polistes exclamans]|nr:hypothetical protein M0804_001211 [Polistes exclamans]
MGGSSDGGGGGGDSSVGSRSNCPRICINVPPHTGTRCYWVPDGGGGGGGDGGVTAGVPTSNMFIMRLHCPFIRTAICNCFYCGPRLE